MPLASPASRLGRVSLCPPQHGSRLRRNEEPLQCSAATEVEAVDTENMVIDARLPEYQERAGVDALAADGGIVRIQPVTAADACGLAELYRRGSADSLRMRFFVVPGPMTLDAEVTRLIRPEYPDRHEAIVVEHS